jgi:hypothetical protein
MIMKRLLSIALVLFLAAVLLLVVGPNVAFASYTEVTLPDNFNNGDKAFMLTATGPNDVDGTSIIEAKPGDTLTVKGYVKLPVSEINKKLGSPIDISYLSYLPVSLKVYPELSISGNGRTITTARFTYVIKMKKLSSDTYIEIDESRTISVPGNLKAGDYQLKAYVEGGLPFGAWGCSATKTWTIHVVPAKPDKPRPPRGR